MNYRRFKTGPYGKDVPVPLSEISEEQQLDWALNIIPNVQRACEDYLEGWAGNAHKCKICRLNAKYVYRKCKESTQALKKLKKAQKFEELESYWKKHREENDLGKKLV